MVQLAKCGSWAMMSGIQWLYEATYRTKTKRKIGIPGACDSKLSGNCCINICTLHQSQVTKRAWTGLQKTSCHTGIFAQVDHDEDT